MENQQKFWSGSFRNLAAVFISLAVLHSVSPAGAGNLPWEVWALINGSAVADLTNSGALNNSPDAVYAITNTFDTFNVGKTDDHNDQYGSRIRGFLQVPATGTYYLFLSSSDASQLSISTNSDPANLVLVAQETNSGAALFSGARLAQRTSPPLNLVKGQSYYLEVLHKASTGSDYVRVGWQTPAGIQQIIPAFYFLPWSPDAITPLITDQPADVTVVQGNPFALTTTVRALQPATFQWYKDNQPLARENGQTLFVSEADTTNAGEYFLAVTNANSNTAISSIATVTVQLDTTPPAILTTELNAKTSVLTVVFSEKLNPATATNLGNYALNNGIVLSGGTLAADGLTVTFNVSGLAAGQTGFVLSVGGVVDRYGNNIVPVNLWVNLVWTETFSGGPGYFTASNLNHTNGNNIDYSFSINAGGSVGEVGGTFVKTLTASAGYIADPTLGAAISLSNNVVIRGQLYAHDANANGNFFIGFTQATNNFASQFGLQLAEPGGGFQPNFRGQGVANGTSSAKFPVAADVVVPFNLNWNAVAGILTAQVGSQIFYSTNLSAAARTYTSLTIAAYGANSIDATRQALIYFDNLTYSVGAVRAAPNATGATIGVTLQSPVSGQVYPQGAPVSFAAQALTAGQPVAKVEFYEQAVGGGGLVKIAETTNSAPTNILFAASWNGAVLGGYTLTARAITTDSLIATSAPVNIYVVAPQVLSPVTEPFAGGLGRFQTQLNSQSLGNNAGFSVTGNAGGAVTGEAGGLFVRSTAQAYLADANTGILYPQLSDLDFSGQLYLQNNNWNGTAFIGYVNRTNVSARFGININEPNTGSGTAFRASVVFGSASSVAINLTPGTPVSYSLHWSSVNQTVTGTVAGTPLSFSYGPLTESFDQLVLGTLGNATADNTAQINLFVDDLNYTTVLPAPRLSISFSGGQVQLNWTVAGFKLQHSSGLGAGTSWSDDNAPVNASGGVFSVIEIPGSTTTFWRLVSQ
ncbi:MAG TPA: PA14 domain-containing protein [Verrucomicrobiae bacterium]|nr:PA14 domain-containing protein [Verrucomicrobiae bacterium]